MDRLTRLAEEHGGLVTYRQILSIMSRETVRSALRRGLLVRERRGLYRVPIGPTDLVLRLRAVQQMSGIQLVGCGPTAGALHGLPGPRDTRLHVTTWPATHLHPPGDVVVHQRAVRSAPVEFEDGVWITEPADTAIDLACSKWFFGPYAVLDGALRLGVTIEQLREAEKRAPKRRGIVAVRDGLQRANPLSESPAESLVRQQIIAAGMSDVESQIEVRTGVGVRRLDLGWRRHRVGVEFDGEEFHTGDGSLRRDRSRLGALLDVDWTLLHVVGADLSTSWTYLGRLRRLLTSRGWTPPQEKREGPNGGSQRGISA